MLITSQSDADKIYADLSQYPQIAIDTEFHWTQTYSPIPALIQVGTEDEVHLIDCTKIKDNSSLKAFLENQQCKKILHSCSQDLILFNIMCQGRTAPIFDSQVAFALLSTNHQISYGKMVEQLTGTKLAKGSQRSNWLKRPLTATQMEYAANDVSWLYKCTGILTDRLNEHQRLHWLESDCQNFEHESVYAETAPDKLYRKLKGIGRSNRQQLAILRELCKWREKAAVKLDLRPRRVLADDALFSIAYKRPHNTRELLRCQNINELTVKYNGNKILECLEIADALPEEDKPELMRPRVPSSAEEKLGDRLSQMITKLSEDLNVAAPLLLTRQQCKKIAGWHFTNLPLDFTFLSQWRQDLLTDDISKVLNKS